MTKYVVKYRRGGSHVFSAGSYANEWDANDKRLDVLSEGNDAWIEEVSEGYAR
jgi:hypothetical protein